MGARKTLYSFDIFDTIITRTTANPSGIFMLVEKRITLEKPALIRKLYRSYSEMRIYAEKVARNLFCKGAVEEIELNQIYSILKTMAPISDEELDYIRNTELDVEFNNSLPIQENILRAVDLF